MLLFNYIDILLKMAKTFVFELYRDHKHFNQKLLSFNYIDILQKYPDSYLEIVENSITKAHHAQKSMSHKTSLLIYTVSPEPSLLTKHGSIHGKKNRDKNIWLSLIYETQYTLWYSKNEVT